MVINPKKPKKDKSCFMLNHFEMGRISRLEKSFQVLVQGPAAKESFNLLTQMVLL